MKIMLGVLLCLSSLFAIEGEAVFDKKCLSCHVKFIAMSKLKENYLDHNNTLLKLTAPTLNQLSYRLKQRIGDPKGDNDMHRMEVAAFISEYVLYPDRQKSLCLEDVMQHFKTMPSLKGKISEEELDEVSTYIYDADEKILEEKGVQYEGFEKALEKAKKEHKIIMLKVMSKDCHFCRKMEREVMIDDEVQNAIEKDFIPVAIDISRTQLPLGLKTELTPSFIFIDENANILMNLPGAWGTMDFLEILREAKTK
ncbi:MAG: thioredoxin family protein [Sulfurovum sp.]|uniref:thioredoxin family protein n=1 Tax=Sulfurovum sp. TaxID=1969726 RepID=UPI002867CEFD|nr:thioredoxin fold domain-containing protein [Sulfurovum sp.]MCO4845155.1 thioredoxin family protein [Sulfurovum sp.]